MATEMRNQGGHEALPGFSDANEALRTDVVRVGRQQILLLVVDVPLIDGGVTIDVAHGGRRKARGDTRNSDVRGRCQHGIVGGRRPTQRIRDQVDAGALSVSWPPSSCPT